MNIPVVPFATVGAVTAIVATAVSVSESLGLLPPALFEARRLWDTNVTLWSVPLPFFVGAWFIAVACVCRTRAATMPAVATLTSLSAAIVVGTCGWLWTRVLPLAMFISGVSAVVVFVAAATSRRAADPMSLRALVRSETARMSLAGALACFVVTASSIRILTTRLPDSLSTERNVRRWYESRVAGVTEGTKHALSIDGAVQVAAFTSYGWQPFRNTVLDRLALVQQFQEAGLEVEFVSRPFPLDPACNPEMASMTIISPGACEAAYAVRHVRNERGKEESARFEEWLYARSTVLDQRLVHSYLERRGLLDGFRAAYGDLKRAVAEDIATARQLGVGGTPTYVVNGLRVPTTETAMRAILSLEAERRQRVHSRMTSTDAR